MNSYLKTYFVVKFLKRVPAAILICAGLFQQSSAQTRYAITDLGTLPGYRDSFVWELTLNNAGQIAAYCNNADNPNAFAGDVGFLWQGPGQLQSLPNLPGASDTIPFSLNDRGDVVGYSGTLPVMWRHGTVEALALGSDDTGGQASQINNSGVIAGVTFFSGGLRAVAWDRVGRIHVLENVPTGNYSTASCINDSGQIAGQIGPDETGWFPAAIWPTYASAPVLLEKPAGNGAGTALSLNNRGQVAGIVFPASVGNWLPALWQGGHLAYLALPAGDATGAAESINAHGQIVGITGTGEFITNPFLPSHAVLWTDDGLIDLQKLMPPDSEWVLGGAASINDRGQIAGYGLHNGQVRAFLMTPTQPQSAAVKGE